MANAIIPSVNWVYGNVAPAAKAAAQAGKVAWGEIPVVSAISNGLLAPAELALGTIGQSRALEWLAKKFSNGTGGANQAKVNKIAGTYQDLADEINGYRGAGLPEGFANYTNDGMGQIPYSMQKGSAPVQVTKQQNGNNSSGKKAGGKSGAVKGNNVPATDWTNNGVDVTYDPSYAGYSKGWAEGDANEAAYMAGQQAAAEMAAEASQAPGYMTKAWMEKDDAREPVIKATDPFDQLAAAYGLNDGGTGQINPELMKQYYINRGTVADDAAAQGLYNILRGIY